MPDRKDGKDGTVPQLTPSCYVEFLIVDVYLYLSDSIYLFIYLFIHLFILNLFFSVNNKTLYVN